MSETITTAGSANAAPAAGHAAGTSHAGGMLTSMGNSLTHAGTATKVFVLAHPVGMVVAGGLILGAGTYYLLGKMAGKKQADEPAAATA